MTLLEDCSALKGWAGPSVGSWSSWKTVWVSVDRNWLAGSASSRCAYAAAVWWGGIREAGGRNHPGISGRAVRATLNEDALRGAGWNPSSVQTTSTTTTTTTTFTPLASNPSQVQPTSVASAAVVADDRKCGMWSQPCDRYQSLHSATKWAISSGVSLQLLSITSPSIAHTRKRHGVKGGKVPVVGVGS